MAPVDADGDADMAPAGDEPAAPGDARREASAGAPVGAPAGGPGTLAEGAAVVAPAEGAPAEGADADPAGPPAISVQFRWGSQVFKRTEELRCGRRVYKSRGTLDGKGGLTLAYSSCRLTGSWELGSESGGCLYFMESDAMTPSALIGNLQWARHPSGTCFITIMQSAADAELGGWVDQPLLAMESMW